MALDGTYTGLQASVADFLNRADLTATIPDFIALAEAQMNRQLQTREMWVLRTITVSEQSLALPPDLMAVESLQVQDNCVRKLRYLTPQQMDEKLINATGVPREYTVAGGCFVFWPTPEQATQVRLRYRKIIDPLSAYNPSNWVLLKHPDAYLYGALLQTAPYLKDDDRLQTWSGLYTSALEQIETADRRIIGDSLEMRSGISDRRHWPWYDSAYGYYP